MTDVLTTDSLNTSFDSGVEQIFVRTPARIAVYDDLLSSPRIIEVMPTDTRSFIGELSSKIYEAAKLAGGKLPYSVILQVTENFIHSYFTEVVVSILDEGNTIRFSDQGPGISDKQKALTPGFSSATSEMKKVIHGVGSGLPIVSEYMKNQSGFIYIEDNLSSGAVVTITLNKQIVEPSVVSANFTNNALPVDKNSAIQTNTTSRATFDSAPNSQNMQDAALEGHSKIIRSQLTPRQQDILRMFSFQNIISVSEISTELKIASSSAHHDLKKLTELGIVTNLGHKRILTEFGVSILPDLI